MQVITNGATFQDSPPAIEQPAAIRRSITRRRPASWGSYCLGALIAASLAVGWRLRGQLLEAETGLGYYFGIAGALSMLFLLAYPMRKHIRLFHFAGPVSFWFRLHMALGLIGPTLILYHANFSLGSMNSNVALTAMLIVAGSGIIGRVFYAKIHRGLYGKRAEARELMAEARSLRETSSIDIGDDLAVEIDALERAAFESAPGMGRAAVKAVSVVARTRKIRQQLRKRVRSASSKNGSDEAVAVHRTLWNRYFNRIEQAAELAFYERLFSAWHLLHLPLFILLIITAIIHVVAVHLY